MKLSAPQHTFLQELNTKYRAFVGGFGSGKTFVGCLDQLLFAGRHPKSTQGYFAPTYPMIRDIYYPTLEEAAALLRFRVEIREANKEAHLYRGGRYYGTVICRSMERPGSIIGFKVARGLVDEIDTLPKDKARQAWNKIVARLRQVVPGEENVIGVTSTPEGFLFVYEQFADSPGPSYSMVQASTYENAAHLPGDYIETLIETYPSELIQAYLRGRFVNLTTGNVYRQFDRQRCASFEGVEPGDELRVGMDFNVGKMAACIFVRRGEVWHCVDEIANGLDTPQVAQTLRSRYPSHKVIVYPDASGAASSSRGAGESDHQILRDHGFTIRTPNQNPRVRDRVNSVNKALEDGRVKVNPFAAPETTRCLEQQPWDANGEPDKKSGLDHQPDAFGYPIAYELPVVKPVIYTGLQGAM